MNERNFTEADVSVLLLYARELQGFPILTEVGHIVAHPNRDRGETTNSILKLYSSMIFYSYYRYQKKTLQVIGECDWWLKFWAINQVDVIGDKRIRNELGTNRKSLKKEIKSWFPCGEKYPEVFVQDFDENLSMLPTRRRLVFECLSQILHLDFKGGFFSYENFRNEIQMLLDTLDIDLDLIEDFFAATCTLFHGRKFYINEKYIGYSQISYDTFLGVDLLAPVPFEKPLPNMQFSNTLNCLTTLFESNVGTDNFMTPLKLSSTEDQPFKLDRATASYSYSRQPKISLELNELLS
jgi:hypothetical protein